jgi:N-acetylneuraminic acid mutarotase
VNTGALYDPAADAWTPMTLTGAPAPRDVHTAVWTGQAMIVWGGTNNVGGDFNSGGRYDPANDSWTATSLTAAPAGRDGHTAVWTGTEMIVWGGGNGFGSLKSGGRYDPSMDRWVPTTLTSAPTARGGHAAIWTGSRMIVWGNSGNTGALYDPASDRWTPTTQLNAPRIQSRQSMIWTGSLMIVWGGNGFSGPPTNAGGRYDPASDTWTPTSLDNAPSARSGHTAIWTGTMMIVWGGGNDVTQLGTGGRYDPTTDAWSPTSMLGAPSARSDPTAVWTGSEMIVFGGLGGFDAGGRYDPVLDTWKPNSTSGAPSPRYGHAAVWTGSEMIVWGGASAGVFGYLNDGAQYDPVSDSWLSIPISGAPSPRAYPTAVWTGEIMIIRSGRDQDGQVPFDEAGYSPSRSAWSSLDTNFETRLAESAVWTGNEMIVWGGDPSGGDGSLRGDGARYDPATGTLKRLSTLNAPSARWHHSAVWTGKEMIVWGGQTVFFGLQNTGARYDPVSDTWRPLSLTDAPSTRANHTAVWSGSEMIVWGGGGNNQSALLSSGGRYAASNPEHPPVARAGAGQTTPCSSSMTPVHLDGGGSSDPDGDPLTFTWSGPFPEGGGVITGPSPTVSLPLGSSSITLTVDDGRGGGASDTTTVTVIDTTAPSVTIATSPAVLWPPDHTLQQVALAPAAQDLCDPGPIVTSLVSVTSSEPDDAPGEGDGHTSGDIENVTFGAAGTNILLRAERSSSGSGRVYTITYTARDATGNVATGTARVTVPRDRSGTPP